MTEQSSQPENPRTGNEEPEVYSVSQDKDGSFRFSRRGFALVSAAIGGTLLLRGVCPRFAARSAAGEAVQAGVNSLPGVFLHTGPSIASNIAVALQPNDFVRLIQDHPDLGWVEVATRSGQQGWVNRSFVDFSGAIRSSSPDFDLSSTATPTPAPTRTPTPFSAQLQRVDAGARNAVAAEQAESCGDAIQNGDFEDGSAPWVEDSTGTIIRGDYPDPWHGSRVAWFGGVDAVERLTQVFHVPEHAQGEQRLDFYVKMTTEETGSQVLDRFRLRFLDAGGSPISPDVSIVDNTTQPGWLQGWWDQEMTEYAGQDLQLQFEAELSVSNATSFILDQVSLDMVCETFYVYLPILRRDPTPTPTSTPTSTPTPSATPCPSHNPCPGYCSSDCASHCSSDCYSDCYSDCGYVCVYECTFDCIYDCGADWCHYN